MLGGIKVRQPRRSNLNSAAEIKAKQIRNVAANKHAKPHVTVENNFKFEGPSSFGMTDAQKNERNKAKRARKK